MRSKRQPENHDRWLSACGPEPNESEAQSSCHRRARDGHE